jgi:hypothetical protein
VRLRAADRSTTPGAPPHGLIPDRSSDGGKVLASDPHLVGSPTRCGVCHPESGWATLHPGGLPTRCGRRLASPTHARPKPPVSRRRMASAAAHGGFRGVGRSRTPPGTRARGRARSRPSGRTPSRRVPPDRAGRRPGRTCSSRGPADQIWHQGSPWLYRSVTSGSRSVEMPQVEHVHGGTPRRRHRPRRRPLRPDLRLAPRRRPERQGPDRTLIDDLTTFYITVRRGLTT